MSSQPMATEAAARRTLFAAGRLTGDPFECRTCGGDGFVQVQDPKCPHGRGGGCPCGTIDVDCEDCRGKGRTLCVACRDRAASTLRIEYGAVEPWCRRCDLEQQVVHLVREMRDDLNKVENCTLGLPTRRDQHYGRAWATADRLADLVDQLIGRAHELAQEVA